MSCTPRRQRSTTTNDKCCPRCGTRVDTADQHCGVPCVTLGRITEATADSWLASRATEWRGVTAGATVDTLTAAFGSRLQADSADAHAALADVLEMLRSAGDEEEGKGVLKRPAAKSRTQHISHPWRVHASVLTSHDAFRKNLVSDAVLEVMPSPGNAAELTPGAPAMGQAVDGCMKRCVASSSFKDRGWSSPRSVCTSLPALGLERARGDPDAVYLRAPVELKTAAALRDPTPPQAAALVTKVKQALQQLALYQLAAAAAAAGGGGGGGRQRGFLVLVGRDDATVCVLEVAHGNVDAANAEWAQWLRDDVHMPAIVCLLNDYADPDGATSFLDVLERGRAYLACCGSSVCGKGPSCGRLKVGRCSFCHCAAGHPPPPPMPPRCTGCHQVPCSHRGRRCWHQARGACKFCHCDPASAHPGASASRLAGGGDTGAVEVTCSSESASSSDSDDGASPARVVYEDNAVTRLFATLTLATR